MPETNDLPEPLPAALVRCSGCPEPASHLYSGRPLCWPCTQKVLDADRSLRVTFTNGVPLDRLRAIRDAGGLVKLLEAFDDMRNMLVAYRGFVGNTGWSCRDNRESAAIYYQQSGHSLDAADLFRTKED